MRSATSLGEGMRETRRLLDMGKTRVLPFWADRGWDRQNGGFYEALDKSGRGLTGIPRRTRAQARQSYVFARCSVAGWVDRTDLAVEGLERLIRVAWNAGGNSGWAHLLDDNGNVLDGRRDLYDHAFIILACAWVYKASGDKTWLDLAAATLDFIDTHMGADHGGFVEAIGAPVLPRRQNPHMHLFEALMALYEVTGDRTLLPRIATLRGLFDTVFFDAQTGHLREFFTADWQVHPERGHVLEPGHFCEWVWLLAECERLTGSAAGKAGSRLFEHAMARGVNPATDLLYAAIGPDGQVLEGGSRTWMQTEWVRAASIEMKRGNPEAPALLEQACKGLADHHLEPVIAGGWEDAIARDGEGESARMPASTLYHFVGSLIEIDTLATAGHLSDPAQTSA